MPKIAQRVLMFAPEQLGEAERFAKFYSATYQLDSRDQRAVSGILNHFQKAHGLRRLAIKLIPNLDIDEAQLEEHGATPADNARELAMVIEASFLEMYSSLDCVVKVLFAIYDPHASAKRRSTRRFFSSYDPAHSKMPPEIVAAMGETGWYKRLLHLRDELTHLETGHIHRDRDTGLIWYSHHGMKEGDKHFLIDDVFLWSETLLQQVNQFIGRVFHFLNSTLSDTETQVVCGMVNGLVLMRSVSGKPPVTFDSGRCIAHTWFDKPENPTCPFVENCGAYQRKVPWSEIGHSSDMA